MGSNFLPEKLDDRNLLNSEPPKARGKSQMVQAAIFKIEDLLNQRAYSPEYLWREFFSVMAKEFGLVAGVVQALTQLEYNDKTILRLLLMGFSSPQKITEILLAAGWPASRIAAAVLHLNELDSRDYFGWEQVAATSKTDILDFLLSSDLAKSQIIAALHDNGILDVRMINRLNDAKWSELELFQAIIEAGCFDRVVCELLSCFKDKWDRPIWTNTKFMELMEQLRLPDESRVNLFRIAGLRLGSIFKLCLESGWNQDRVIAAFILAGLTPGAVFTSFIEVVRDRINAKIEKITRGKYQAKPGEIEAEIRADMAEAINILAKTKTSDREILAELYSQEWIDTKIIYYFLAAGWSPQRILKAAQQYGWNEAHITRTINELAAEYKEKKNNYWTPEIVRRWKLMIDKMFPHSEVVKLLRNKTSQLSDAVIN